MGVRAFISVVTAALLFVCGNATAQKKYGPGVTDTEIKVGNTFPYSGPASAYGAVGKALVAYVAMINDQGGINGRKINMISLDDGYSPPRTVQQTRKLVEQDEVLMIYHSLGTPTNTSIHKYMNEKKVPQLFISTGASKWADPKNFPWTIAFLPGYHIESKIYAQYILKNKPDAKIAVLYQNDDYGKDYYEGFKRGLGDKTKLIVAEATYEISDPTIDSQIVQLKSSGADTMVTFATPKFAAQTIRKLADIGWKPLHFLNNVSTSVGSVLTPAGLEKSKDIIAASYLKDPTDPRFKDDAAVKAWEAWMKKYNSGADVKDIFSVQGYAAGMLLVQVLKACGDDLTRENVMKQATSLKDVEIPILLPGIKVNTSATDYSPIGEMQMMRFDGTRWQTFGEVMSGR